MVFKLMDLLLGDFFLIRLKTSRNVVSNTKLWPMPRIFVGQAFVYIYSTELKLTIMDLGYIFVWWNSLKNTNSVI